MPTDSGNMTLGELLKQKLDQSKPTLVDTMANIYADSAPQQKQELPKYKSYDVTLFKLSYYDLKLYREEHILFCNMERLAKYMAEEMQETIRKVGRTRSRFENIQLSEHSMNVYADDEDYCPPEYIGDFYMIRCHRDDGPADPYYVFRKSKTQLIEFLSSCSDSHPEISTVSALGEWKNEGDPNVDYWS